MFKNFLIKKNKKMPILIIYIILLLLFFYSLIFNFNIEESIPVNGYNNIKVIPGGSITGIKLYVDGILVVGKSDVIGNDNRVYKPISKTDIKEGDRIIKVNDITINNSNDLIEYLSKCNGEELTIQCVRNNNTFTQKITPIKSKDDGQYKLGLWVKDGAIGIGTISFYQPDTNRFGALGHGITDIDTGKLVESNNGKLVNAKIISITRGKRTVPGELKGIFNEENSNGQINLNSKIGIYGTYNKINTLEKYKQGISVAKKEEIKVGNATILCTIEDKIEEYNIEIKKIYNDNNTNKNMLIKITDERLLEKTGGIVQGMSGAPIIQNNKFIGAITHVLVSDPTTGYAVLGEIMLEKSIKLQ